MFVALSIPDWPTGAAGNDLLAALLAVAPRAAVAPREHVAWLDAWSLDPVAMTARARAELTAIGVTVAGAGASRIPVAAAVAAQAGHDLALIPPDSERSYLAQLPISALGISDTLHALLHGVGLTSCGEVAQLTRESVEVRFGREGLSLWRRARADDPRPLFSARPRTLPSASLDWTEFSTTDLEQLIFVLHSLLKTVCDALLREGTGARALECTLMLENRTVLTQLVGAARATAQRTTWLRLMRRALERLTLPDRVTGIVIQVTSTGAPAVRQGDLFDLGFASAHAAESAVAHILDLQPDAVITPKPTAHLLPERRVAWEADPQGTMWQDRPCVEGALGLHPQLLPVARSIAVITRWRRGFMTPIRYSDNGVNVPLTECLGPHCVSGQRWSAPFAREYHQGVREDGSVALLYRDAVQDTWYLAGWWE